MGFWLFWLESRVAGCAGRPFRRTDATSDLRAAELYGPDGGLGAVRNPQLLDDALHVGLHRGEAHQKLQGYLTVGLSYGYEAYFVSTWRIFRIIKAYPPTFRER